MTLRQSLLVFFIAVGVASCKDAQTHQIKPPQVDSLYNTTDEDQAMNEAIAMANKTLDLFDSAWRSKRHDRSSFCLKVKFPTDNGNEHIWLNEISLKDGQYSGNVSDAPEVTKKVKMGERVLIDKKDITDWMYLDNNILKGGYTIRVIYNRMSREERKKAAEEYPFKIEQ